MGVMRCDRGDCENILCDRYSYEYGYICDECFEELKAHTPIVSIKEFMSSPKRTPDYSDPIRDAALQVIESTFTKS